MLPESADLCFLYRCLVKPLWSADNVEVSEASWVCKDANAAFVDSLRSDDSIRELREFEISFTSLIVLDTADDSAERLMMNDYK